MRSSRRSKVSRGVGWPIAAGAVALATGCWDAYEEVYKPLTELDGTAGSGGSTTSTTIPPGCMPSQTPNPVSDGCGVFVSSSMGDDANSGTSKDEPLRTIGAACRSPPARPVSAAKGKAPREKGPMR